MTDTVQEAPAASEVPQLCVVEYGASGVVKPSVAGSPPVLLSVVVSVVLVPVVTVEKSSAVGEKLNAAGAVAEPWSVTAAVEEPPKMENELLDAACEVGEYVTVSVQEPAGGSGDGQLCDSE